MGQDVNRVCQKGQDVNRVRREGRIRMLTGLGRKGKSGQDVKGVRSEERVSGHVFSSESPVSLSVLAALAVNNDRRKFQSYFLEPTEIEGEIMHEFPSTIRWHRQNNPEKSWWRKSVASRNCCLHVYLIIHHLSPSHTHRAMYHGLPMVPCLH